MYRYYSEIDNFVLAGIQKYENQQLSKFQHEFERLCLSISHLHGWNYTAGVHRWIDTADTWRGRHFDGYTATLQVDFTDPDGNLIEIDENVCSFFENITFISFDPLLQNTGFSKMRYWGMYGGKSKGLCRKLHGLKI